MPRSVAAATMACVLGPSHEMAENFVNQAAAGLRLAHASAAARVARENEIVLRERDRIAADLREVVIQRLFGISMRLQALASIHPKDAQLELTCDDIVVELDSAILDLRTSIFDLQPPGAASDECSVTRQLRSACDRFATLLGASPHVETDGAVDVLVDDIIAEAILTVVNEVFLDIAQYGRPWVVDLMLTAGSADGVALRITAEGTHVDASEVRQFNVGADIRRSATALGGEASIATRKGRSLGVEVLWHVPLGTARGDGAHGQGGSEMPQQ